MTCCQNHPPRRRACRIAGRILLGILLGMALAAVFGAVVMWLWNYTLPALFQVRPIHFWQAVALLILARILVGGHHGWHHRSWRRRHGAPGGWCGCGREEEGPVEPGADVRGTEA
ncbi:MAG: hypothetical protein ABSH53_24360 [Holophaga sp.]|jgi:hypothetical protein